MNYHTTIEQLDAKLVAMAFAFGIVTAFECDGDMQKVIATEDIQ
jgi:hypothetical protein